MDFLSLTFSVKCLMAPRTFGFKSTAEDVLKGIDVRGKNAIVTGGSSGVSKSVKAVVGSHVEGS